MAYKQNFGRANIGTTGASLQNTNLINPVSTDPPTDPPTDPVTGPKTKAESTTGVDDKNKFGYISPQAPGQKSTIAEPSNAYKEAFWKPMYPITGDSGKYKVPALLSNKNNQTMDLSSLIKDKNASGFEKTYNNPDTKAMMLAQTNLTSGQYDNMVVQGLEANKIVGGNIRGSRAEAKNGNIHIGEDYLDDGALETHERVHESQFDTIQQENIKRALGSAYKQPGRTFMKQHDPQSTEYFNQPHEQYGNFAEFREGLGLKPGADITPEQLKILVKKKGLDQSGFYMAYDEENIVNALKTVASVTKKTDGPFSEGFKRNRDSALS